MSLVRSIDEINDWMFGRGKNDYKKNREAVIQCIKTRLQSFLGDCFFDLTAGIDWFNLLGSKNVPALTLAIRATILNTDGVTMINQVELQLDSTRKMRVVYNIKTVYGNVVSTEAVVFAPEGDYLLLQDSGFLTLENTGLIIL